MSKYKLLKWYPSLPVSIIEGDIVTYNKDLEKYSKDITLDLIAPREVEYMPEYWEKVVEHKFKITSFVTISNYGSVPKGTVSRIKEYVDGDSNHEAILEHLIDNPFWQINSVKRISDGMSFSLGDMVSNPGKPPFKLFQIRLDDGEIIFTAKNGGICPDSSKCNVSTILLETMDGVKKSEGDIVIGVILDDDLISYQLIEPFELRKENLDLLVEKKVFLFSTIEKVEEFLALKLRILSLEDVSNFYKSSTSRSKGTRGEELFSFVKKRINGKG